MAAAGETLNPELLAAAVGRGASGTLALLDLADEMHLPLHVPARPETKRRAAAMLQQMIGRPLLSLENEGKRHV